MLFKCLYAAKNPVMKGLLSQIIPNMLNRVTLNTKSSGNLTLNRQDIRRKREGAPSLFLAENQGLPTHATGGYPNAIRNPSTQKAVFSPSCLRC